MEEIKHSPVILTSLVKQMTFPEAMGEVIDGRKVTKLEWGNNDIYGYVKNGLLMLHKEDGLDYQWLINDGDLMGLDFIVRKDPD